LKLWTVWNDYYATGEGRTLMGWIAYARDQSEALAQFGDAFVPYFARGANAAEGVVGNDVIDHLFSQRVLDDVRSMESGAAIQLTGRLHFNLA
jgi:hypothetical protein